MKLNMCHSICSFTEPLKKEKHKKGSNKHCDVCNYNFIWGGHWTAHPFNMCSDIQCPVLVEFNVFLNAVDIFVFFCKFFCFPRKNNENELVSPSHIRFMENDYRSQINFRQQNQEWGSPTHSLCKLNEVRVQSFD